MAMGQRISQDRGSTIMEHKETSLPLGVKQSDWVDNALRVLALFLLQLLFFAAQAAVLGAETSLNNSNLYYLRVVALVALATLNGYVCGLGWFGIAHEATHRLYFEHKGLNDLVGGLAHALLGIPFQGFREFHHQHHQHTHVKGQDPKDDWQDYPFWVAFVGFHIAPRDWYCNSLRHIMTGGRHPWKLVADTICLALAYCYYRWVLPTFLGMPVTSCALPFQLAQAPINILRALTDHYGQPGATTSTTTSSSHPFAAQNYGRIVYANPVMEWLGSHGNYHALHHRWPTLPHGHYKEVFHRYRHDPWEVHDGYVGLLWSLSSRRHAYDDGIGIKTVKMK